MGFRMQNLPEVRPTGAPAPEYASLAQSPYNLAPLPPISQPQMTPITGGGDVAFAAPVAAPSPMAAMPVQMEMRGPQTSIETQGKGYRPEDLKALQQAQEDRKKAIEAETKIQADIAEQQQKSLAAIKAEYDASFLRSQEKIQAKQQQYDTMLGDYNTAVQKYRDAKLVDPRAQENIFQRIGAAIAVGLGAYGSAINKTPNFALQIMNDTISRNIDRQKFEIEKLGTDTAMKRNDLARLTSELGNADLAEKALRQTLLEKSRMEVERFTAQSNSPLVKSRGAALIAGINEEQAKTLAEAHAITQRHVDSSGNTSVTTLPQNKTAGLDTPLGRAATETGATKLRDAYATYLKGKGSLDNFDRFIKRIDLANYTPGKQGGEFDNAKDEVINVLRVLNELGTLQQGEYDRLSKEIAGIKSPATLQGRAKGIRSRLDRDVQAIQAAWAVNAPQGSQMQQQKQQYGFQR